MWVGLLGNWDGRCNVLCAVILAVFDGLRCGGRLRATGGTPPNLHEAFEGSSGTFGPQIGAGGSVYTAGGW